MSSSGEVKVSPKYCENFIKELLFSVSETRWRLLGIIMIIIIIIIIIIVTFLFLPPGIVSCCLLHSAKWCEASRQNIHFYMSAPRATVGSDIWVFVVLWCCGAVCCDDVVWCCVVQSRLSRHVYTVQSSHYGVGINISGEEFKSNLQIEYLSLMFHLDD